MRYLVNFIGAVGSPKEWPLWVRRSFVLTLPVAFPLWFVLLAVTLILSGIASIAIPFTEWAQKMWSRSPL